ncbi:MAG: DNA translocase FtsK [Lentisphaerae bacterium]|nr:DNA translocase FtsK [Lentisphaerota bacterium]
MGSGESVPDMGRRVLWGFLLTGLCLFLALSLFSYDWRDIGVLQAPPNAPPVNLFGPVGAWVSFGLFMGFGLGAYLVPWMSLTLGVILIVNRQKRVWPRLLWGLALLGTVVAIMQLDGVRWHLLCQKLNILPDSGGLLGRLLVRELLVRWLSPVGAGLLTGAVMLLSLVMTIEPRNVLRGAMALIGIGRRASQKIGESVAERQDRREQIEKETRQIEKQRRRLERVVGDKRSAEPATLGERPSGATPAVAAATVREEPRRTALPPEPEPETDAADLDLEDAPVPPPRPEKEKPASMFSLGRKERAVVPSVPDSDDDEADVKDTGLPIASGLFQLPPIDLLAPRPPDGKRDGIKADTATTSRILVETLQEFGIEGQITNVEVGPVVTNYELLPAPGVRVERISGLSNNLALSLKATSVRVQAPIPGKGVVGIEVPNTVSQLVLLREVLEGDVWQSGRAKVPLALGKDVTGADLVADLATMPHLLIAGATGAGKTVCMNSILAGLLMSRTPEQLRLLLVDPKIVEFSIYNRLPHLVVPVITDPKKVALGLRWAINEMERRYKLFARVGVRNIDSYNTREIVKQPDLFGDSLARPKAEDEPPARVPYIVIIIDELADLMLTDPAEIENCIARLAQLSRAVGIHMIIATQRPSVNVITGTIKANFPARIAFQVAQKNDSRIILDSMGAEKLLGRGDMLYMPPGSSRLVRAQGALCADTEIRAITDFARSQGTPAYEVSIHQKLEKAEQGGDTMMDDGGEDEELLGRAVEIIRETRRASTSSLQRRLRIGYTRAARIMDVLEERGILGPPRGAEAREILIDLDGGIPNNNAAPEDEDLAAEPRP